MRMRNHIFFNLKGLTHKREEDVAYKQHQRTSDQQSRPGHNCSLFRVSLKEKE